jgi:hypothetical protein
VSVPPEPWDDDVADLLAMVSVAWEDSSAPGWQEALRAVTANCDRDGVLSVALKLLAELASDLGWCPECFREWAFTAVART